LWYNIENATQLLKLLRSVYIADEYFCLQNDEGLNRKEKQYVERTRVVYYNKLKAFERG
jgi:hypothetical protein